jgi:hypothetical protein
MSRKPTPAPESKETPVNAEAIAQDFDAANQLSVIERQRQDLQAKADQEKDEVFAVGIDLGRLEALDFITTVGNSAILPIYENVKKSKGWAHLRNPESSNGRKFQSLEEFCQVKLGKTYSRLQQLVANRNLIGQDVFEQAERLGLRQVDYNAIKSLPAPDQELVRRAVEEAKTRDDVLDLLQELAARHAREKGYFTRQAAEAEQERAATTKRLEVVTKQKEAAEAKAAHIAVLPPDEALAGLLYEAGGYLAQAQGAVNGGLRAALIALKNHPDDNTHYMAGMVGQLMSDLVALRDEFNLPDVLGDGTPEWERWNVAQEALRTAKANG